MDMRTYLQLKRKALLMSSNQWFMPTGITAAQVLAAYQFVGQQTEAYSLLDLSGNGRTLAKSGSVTWSKTSGFTIPATSTGSGSSYLNNDSLNACDIRCCVLRYADMTLNNRDYLMSACGSTGYARIYGTSTLYMEGYASGLQNLPHRLDNHKGLGYQRSDQVAFVTTTNRASGVVGANFLQNNALYYNGSPLTSATTKTTGTYTDPESEIAYTVEWHTVNSGSARTFGNSHPNISDLNNAPHSGHRIQAACFFNIALTATQHAEVAAAMALL